MRCSKTAKKTGSLFRLTDTSMSVISDTETASTAAFRVHAEQMKESSRVGGQAVLCTPKMWRPQEWSPLPEDLRLAQPPLQSESARPAGRLLPPAISCLRGCKRFPSFSFPDRHGFRTTPSACDLCRSSLTIRELAFSFRASFPFRW